MLKFLKEGLKKAVSAIKRSVTKAKEEQEREEIGKLKEEAPKPEEAIVKEKESKVVEKKAEEKKEKLIDKIKQKFTTFQLSEVEFERAFWELEMVLLANNVAILAIEKIRGELKKELTSKRIKRGELEYEITKGLRKSLEKLLLDPFDLVKEIKKEKKPYVIVFFGVNGSGKTTTIAKIAHLLKKNKISCVLSASDTFRAASLEQLEEHANNLNIELIKHKYGADPAAVAFDAIAHAKAKKVDAVLIDTAGRMHSNINLIEEMKKICRVTNPSLKIFVGEAIIGNDAVAQAKEFDKNIGIDGIILAKADVDEKGGAAISTSYVTNKPILFLGTGQEYNDLEIFNKEKIIKSLGL